MQSLVVRCIGRQNEVLRTNDFLQGSKHVGQFCGCQNVIAIDDEAMQFSGAINGGMTNDGHEVAANLFDGDFQRAGCEAQGF